MKPFYYLCSINNKFNQNMKKQLTVRQWLETLPEPLRSAAIKNVSFPILNSKELSLSQTLMRSFTWDATEDGYEFWRSFYESLEWAENED